MSEKKIKKGPPLELHLEQETALTEIIKAIVLEKDSSILAYNICKDHVHLVLVCAEDEVFGIAKTLKGKSSYLYQSKGFKPLGDSLWSQKFFFALNCIVFLHKNPLITFPSLLLLSCFTFYVDYVIHFYFNSTL